MRSRHIDSPLTADLRYACPSSQLAAPSHREEGREASAAELLGPNGECIGLLLNPVMVDHQNVDPHPLGQQDCHARVDSVIDGDQNVGTGQGD
jgi:hypothetical protein